MPYRTLEAACARIQAHDCTSRRRGADPRQTGLPIPIPIWGRPWARPRRSSPSRCSAMERRIELKFGFPCADYGAELHAGAADLLGAGAGRRAARSHVAVGNHRARRSADLEAPRQRQEYRGRGLWQGRGGQIDHGGQSGARLGGAGRAGRAAGCRYLWAEPAADDGSGGHQAADAPTASTSRRFAPTASR